MLHGNTSTMMYRTPVILSKNMSLEKNHIGKQEAHNRVFSSMCSNRVTDFHRSQTKIESGYGPTAEQLLRQIASKP